MKRKQPKAKRPSLFERTETFLVDYTRGLSGEELRRLFDHDAKGAYSVLMRDREAQVESVTGLKRYLLAAKLLFLSLSEKLSPRRRLLFGVAVIATVTGIVDPQLSWMAGDHREQLSGSGLFFLVAIVSLLLLLAFEMLKPLLYSLFALLSVAHALPEVQLGKTTVSGRVVSETIEFFGGMDRRYSLSVLN